MIPTDNTHTVEESFAQFMLISGFERNSTTLWLCASYSCSLFVVIFLIWVVEHYIFLNGRYITWESWSAESCVRFIGFVNCLLLFSEGENMGRGMEGQEGVLALVYCNWHMVKAGWDLWDINYIFLDCQFCEYHKT